MLTKITKRILLHAPNIHTGGGLELLKCLLSVSSSSFDFLLLDKRIQGNVVLPEEVDVYWVKRSFFARLYAEWQLFRRCAPSDTVLCFHGLPPLLPLRGRVIVFVQNRILFESCSLVGYPLFTKIRLSIERLWVRARSRNCQRYFVQTPSMATAVRHCVPPDIEISVQPFLSQVELASPEQRAVVGGPRFDFVYVASGEAHKNHGCLLEAWRLLAEGGMTPSLALTVSPESYPYLASEIARYAKGFSLNIVNVGYVSREQIHGLYQSSSALIFTSKLESFGLPLIEANQLGLPVLAPELDYVRDVVQPAETFDPSSPISIARAVRRFFHEAEPALQIRSAEEFMAEVRR